MSNIGLHKLKTFLVPVAPWYCLKCNRMQTPCLATLATRMRLAKRQHLLQLHWDWSKPRRNRWSKEGKSLGLKIVQDPRLKRLSTSMSFEGCRMHQVNPATLPASCHGVAFALPPGSKLHQKPIGTLDAILMLLVTFQIRKYSQDVACSKITGNILSAHRQTRLDMEGRIPHNKSFHPTMEFWDVVTKLWNASKRCRSMSLPRSMKLEENCHGALWQFAVKSSC